MMARLWFRGVLVVVGLALACSVRSAHDPEEIYVGYYQEAVIPGVSTWPLLESPIRISNG
jgi:hypothetical protein